VPLTIGLVGERDFCNPAAGCGCFTRALCVSSGWMPAANATAAGCGSDVADVTDFGAFGAFGAFDDCGDFAADAELSDSGVADGTAVRCGVEPSCGEGMFWSVQLCVAVWTVGFLRTLHPSPVSGTAPRPRPHPALPAIALTSNVRNKQPKPLWPFADVAAVAKHL
jgi:hypothetical protein